MPRPLRRYGKSSVYHIIFKGIDNQAIFYDDQDRRIFLEHVSITKKDYNYTIYAYCLMGNHVHMVIKCQNDFLSKSMQSLLVRYVHYFNQKYKRIGPLLQNRFKSKNVETQMYFVELCRYVHRNPENAGIALTQNYEWSSYKEYLGKEKLINKKALLHYFNNDINEFVNFTTKTLYNENMEDFFEYELIEKLSDEQLANLIMQKFNIKDISDIGAFFKLKSKDELKKDLAILKNIKNTNVTQLSRVTRIGRRFIENA